MQRKATHFLVSSIVLHGLTSARRACGVEIGAQVWVCGASAIVLLPYFFLWDIASTSSKFLLLWDWYPVWGVFWRSCDYWYGAPSESLMIRTGRKVAPTGEAKKLHPRIILVFCRFTMLNATAFEFWLLMVMTNVIVLSTTSILLLASCTLMLYWQGQCRWVSPADARAAIKKLNPEQVSNTSSTFSILVAYVQCRHLFSWFYKLLEK